LADAEKKHGLSLNVTIYDEAKNRIYDVLDSSRRAAARYHLHAVE
jgi:hypothetical protein